MHCHCSQKITFFTFKCTPQILSMCYDCSPDLNCEKTFVNDHRCTEYKNCSIDRKRSQMRALPFKSESIPLPLKSKKPLPMIPQTNVKCTCNASTTYFTTKCFENNLDECTSCNPLKCQTFFVALFTCTRQYSCTQANTTTPAPTTHSPTDPSPTKPSPPTKPIPTIPEPKHGQSNTTIALSILVGGVCYLRKRQNQNQSMEMSMEMRERTPILHNSTNV